MHAASKVVRQMAAFWLFTPTPVFCLLDPMSELVFKVQIEAQIRKTAQELIWIYSTLAMASSVGCLAIDEYQLHACM